MAKITEIPAECPQCSGPIWDNTKRPKRNPKAPDAACKDKDHCRWAGWLPETAKSANGSIPRAPQQYPWAPLLKLCVQYAKKEIAPILSNTTDEDVIYKYAYTIFAAAKDGGDIFKKAAPVPTPQPPAPPTQAQSRRAEYDDTQASYDYFSSDEGLPF